MGLASGMVEFSMKLRGSAREASKGGGNCHEIGNFSGSFDVTNHCDVCLVLCCSGRAASRFKQALPA